MKTLRFFLLAAGAIVLTQVNGAALACAACYGKSDSPMAKGMNAGIFALLGVVAVVLSAAATFFVFLARRAHAVSKQDQSLKVNE